VQVEPGAGSDVDQGQGLGQPVEAHHERPAPRDLVRLRAAGADDRANVVRPPEREVREPLRRFGIGLPRAPHGRVVPGQRIGRAREEEIVHGPEQQVGAALARLGVQEQGEHVGPLGEPGADRGVERGGRPGLEFGEPAELAAQLVEEQVPGRDGPLPQDLGVRAGEGHHRGRPSAGGPAAVQHGRQPVQLGRLVRGHRVAGAAQVRARGRDGLPHLPQQGQRDGVVGDADAERRGPAVRRGQDQREWAGPPAVHEGTGALVDVHEPGQLRRLGDHGDERKRVGPPLDLVDMGARPLVPPERGQAIDGVGRKGDHVPGPEELSGPREALRVGRQPLWGHRGSDRSSSPGTLPKSRTFRVARARPNSSAVAAINASAISTPVSRRSRPARSAMARSTGISRNAANTAPICASLARRPANSSHRVTTE
jgi:hypothetical protein